MESVKLTKREKNRRNRCEMYIDF